MRPLIITLALLIAASENRWEETIQAYEQQDRDTPPPKEATLFLGSSSIRLWDLPRYFPDLVAINRGFGGSYVSDSVEFATRVAIPYKPKTIVFYAGDNDIASDKSPETVFEDFKKLVAIVHHSLPKTRIVFISIKPSIARWEKIGLQREANRMIREWIEKNDRLAFIDLEQSMLGKDEKPRPELFVEDGLHLSEKGYDLWSSLLRKQIEGRK